MLTDQLNQIIEGLGWLGFEAAIMGGALLILVIGLWVKNILVAQGLFVISLLVALSTVSFEGASTELFLGALTFDALGSLMKLVFGAVSVWIIFYPNAKKHPSEFYFLILAVILGSALMLSASNLLVIYLAIELVSFSSYIITNFDFEKKSFEAGIKYLIFGGVSSAVGLYGASLLYGFTGTLDLSEMDVLLMNDNMLFQVGLLAFIAALLFKVSIVPFHIWVPSTYQAAPTDAVAIISVIPKISGFVLLHRVLLAFDFASNYWLYIVLGIFGMLTIGVGTLGAMSQTNVKRLIAYGAIAHSGFMLAALLVSSEDGAVAFAWYAFVYAIMNVVVFYFVSLFESQGISEVSDFAGFSKTEPYLGILLVLVMIALIGLPPTAGFSIKFYLFTVMWNSYQNIGDSLMLTYLIIAVLSVVFSLFFYLKMPYNYFFKDSGRSDETGIIPSQRLIATIFTIVLLWFFFRPEILNNIADNIKFIAW